MRFWIQLIRDHRLFVLLVVGTLAIGFVAHVFAQTFILLAGLLLLWRERYEIFLFFFIFVLVASDNYFLHFARVAKPVLIVLLPIMLYMKGMIRRESSVLRYFAIFFVLNGVVLFFAEYASVGFQKALSYFFLFLSVPPLVLELWKRDRDVFIKRILEFQLLIAIINIAYVLIEPEYVFSHGDRFRGIFGNPNGLAMYCYFAIVTFLILNKQFQLNLNRFFQITYLVLFLGILLLSGSRASLISVFIFFFISRFKRNEFFAGTVVTTLAVFFSGEIVGMFQDVIVFLGFQEEFRIAGNEAQSIETGSGRLIAWKFAWDKITTAFFFGRGWAFEETWFHLPSIQNTLNQLNHQGGAHNVFLILWLNSGLVGLIAFLAGLFRMIYVASNRNKLAVPLIFSALFLSNFEPWLTASLNPYTIQFLILVSIMLFLPIQKADQIEDE